MSSNFNIVSLYFVIISLIFVIVTILFVLPCRWVVNHKSNFVLCHSFSHICNPISSALHRPIYINLGYLLTLFSLLFINHSFVSIYIILRCSKVFFCFVLFFVFTYLFCQLRVRAFFHKTVRVCHVYCNFKVGFACRITVIFGTLKDGSLFNNTLASNIRFRYRNMLQNGVDALSKKLTPFCQKSSKFYLVQIIR